jgi:hypothetical protein
MINELVKPILPTFFGSRGPDPTGWTAPTPSGDGFLATLHKVWYVVKDGKYIQVLPSTIADLLTPVALAFWCASDGYYQ